VNDLYDQLVSALRGIPPLPGALCRGHWQMFDDADDPVVTEAAIDRCRQWADSQPRGALSGVVAGKQCVWVAPARTKQPIRRAS
jgi:hypothetical protein